MPVEFCGGCYANPRRKPYKILVQHDQPVLIYAAFRQHSLHRTRHSRGRFLAGHIPPGAGNQTPKLGKDRPGDNLLRRELPQGEIVKGLPHGTDQPCGFSQLAPPFSGHMPAKRLRRVFRHGQTKKDADLRPR